MLSCRRERIFFFSTSPSIRLKASKRLQDHNKPLASAKNRFSLNSVAYRINKTPDTQTKGAKDPSPPPPYSTKSILPYTVTIQANRLL